jgi:hypothetical protein
MIKSFLRFILVLVAIFVLCFLLFKIFFEDSPCLNSGQDISTELFWSSCAWFLSIPFILVGLILSIRPDFPYKINLLTAKYISGLDWKDDQNEIIKRWSERPFGRIGIRFAGITFLIVGVVIFVLQITR